MASARGPAHRAFLQKGPGAGNFHGSGAGMPPAATRCFPNQRAQVHMVSSWVAARVSRPSDLAQRHHRCKRVVLAVSLEMVLAGHGLDAEESCALRLDKHRGMDSWRILTVDYWRTPAWRTAHLLALRTSTQGRKSHQSQSFSGKGVQNYSSVMIARVNCCSY